MPQQIPANRVVLNNSNPPPQPQQFTQPQETSISPIPNAPPQENSESPAPTAPPQQIPMPQQIPTNRVVLNNSNPLPQPQQQEQGNPPDNGLKTPDLPLQGGFMEQIRNSIIDVLNNR